MQKMRVEHVHTIAALLYRDIVAYIEARETGSKGANEYEVEQSKHPESDR